jgi:hypothetical protein
MPSEARRGGLFLTENKKQIPRLARDDLIVTFSAAC